MFQFCPFCRGEVPTPTSGEDVRACPCGRCLLDAWFRMGTMERCTVVLTGPGSGETPTVRFNMLEDGRREMVSGYRGCFTIVKDSDFLGPAPIDLDAAQDFLELAPVLES